MRKVKIILLSFLLILSLHNTAFSTGPSFLRIKIKPVTYNDRGDILFKTLFRVNKTGAHRPMSTEYGWLVVSASGVWEEYLHKVTTPDLNIKEHRICEKEFKNDFKWDAAPLSVLPILKRYNFVKRDIERFCFKTDKTKNSTKKITVSGKNQKSANGIKAKMLSGNPEQLKAMGPLFLYRGVAVINNYSCNDIKNGADFNLESLYTNNYLNSEKEFIECFDIDAVRVNSQNLLRKGRELKINVEDLHTLQVFVTKDGKKALKIAEKLFKRFSDAYVFKDIKNGSILYKIRIGMKSNEEIFILNKMIGKEIKELGLGLYKTKIDTYKPKLVIEEPITAKYILNKSSGKRILLMEGEIKNNYPPGKRITDVMVKISFFTMERQFIKESKFPAGRSLSIEEIQNKNRGEIEKFFRESVQKIYIKHNKTITFQRVFFEVPEGNYYITTKISAYTKTQR